MAHSQGGPSSSNNYRTLQRTAQASSAPTLTQTTAPLSSMPQPRQAVLRLRGATASSGEGVDEAEAGPQSARRTTIQWAEDVVDNEGLGRKKSKVCCIYHAPKGIDESSDESSSDSDDSDSDAGDDGSARPSGGGRKACGDHDHAHGDHGHGHGHGKGHGSGKKRSPNAYEKIPKPRNGGGKLQRQ